MRKKTIDGVGLRWKKKENTTASPIKKKFFFSLFCFVLFLWSWTVSHTCFVECVMNYTPPLLSLCLCCGGAPAVCTSYNILRCEFSMPVYRPGFFWTGIEKWLFEKSLWWWAQFVFTAEKSLFERSKMWADVEKKSRGLSWEGRRLPVWLSPPLSAWAVCAGCSPACAIWLTWNENRIVSLMFHQPACVCNCLSICLSKYKSILTPTYVWNQDRMIKRKEFIYLPLFILLSKARGQGQCRSVNS